jgi:RNA polymerase sigma-32 factor
MTDLITIANLLPLGNADAYIRRVQQIPLLTAEQELNLAARWHQQQDLNAARSLVMANLRFVVHIARSYQGYGLPLADLIQEGSIGLMKAVKRFDPAVGVRLISFAVQWIRAEIHEFILRNWRIVKIATTKAQRKLFFGLRQARQRLGWFSSDEAQAIAAELGVTKRDVQEMEGRMLANDITLDSTTEEDGTVAPIQYLHDRRYDPARLLEASDSTEQSQYQVQQALAALDTRSQEIIKQRWLCKEKATLQTLAEQYGVSIERIRQLENNALKKLGQHLKTSV